MAAWAQLLPATGAALMAAGLAFVFVAWRRRHLRTGWRRVGLGAGWMMVAAGSLACAADHVDVGLAEAATMVMLFGLAGIVAHSLTLNPSRKPSAETRSAPCPGGDRTGPAGPIARLVGAMAAGPAFGLLGALLAVKWSPGDPATRLMAMAIIAVLAAAAALVFLLATARPVRAAGVLACASVIFGLLLALPESLQP